MNAKTRRAARLLGAIAASFGAGAVVGVIYWLVKVPSPAPPPIALVGLLGMVIGERVANALLAAARKRRATARDR
jgi:XapX domain-containing protein